MTSFVNRANSREDADDAAIAAELTAAGIPVETMPELLRGQTGSPEVRTVSVGLLHGWAFYRYWYYWSCKGPGINFDDAVELHEMNLGIRVDGHCANPHPLEMSKGLAISRYHVDSVEGLKALADMIKRTVRQATQLKPVKDDSMSRAHDLLEIEELTEELAVKPVEPIKKVDYCEEHKKPGGCQRHNLHCGWPKCNEPPKDAVD